MTRPPTADPLAVPVDAIRAMDAPALLAYVDRLVLAANAEKAQRRPSERTFNALRYRRTLAEIRRRELREEEAR